MLWGIEVAASRFSNVWFETTAFGKMAFFTLPCHKTNTVGMRISRSHPCTCSDNLAALRPYHSLEAFIRRNQKLPGVTSSCFMDDKEGPSVTRRPSKSSGKRLQPRGRSSPDLDLKDNFFNASTNMSAEYLDLSSSLGSAKSNSSVDGAATQYVNTCKKHLSLALRALRRVHTAHQGLQQLLHSMEKSAASPRRSSLAQTKCWLACIMNTTHLNITPRRCWARSCHRLSSHRWGRSTPIGRRTTSTSASSWTTNNSS